MMRSVLAVSMVGLLMVIPGDVRHAAIVCQEGVDPVVKKAEKQIDKEKQRHNITLVGTIIAESVTVESITYFSDMYNYQTLLLRVDKWISGRGRGQYVIVKYKYFADGEPRLSPDIFDAAKRWRFALRRHRACDGSLKASPTPKVRGEVGHGGDPPVLRRSRGAEAVEIPSRSLPCYVLLPGNLTAHQ